MRDHFIFVLTDTDAEECEFFLSVCTLFTACVICPSSKLGCFYPLSRLLSIRYNLLLLPAAFLNAERSAGESRKAVVCM